MQNMAVTPPSTLTMGITKSRHELQSTFCLPIPFILLDGSSHSPITVPPLAASIPFCHGYTGMRPHQWMTFMDTTIMALGFCVRLR